MGWIPEIWQSLKGRPTLSLLRFNWSSFSICWKSTPEDVVVLLLRAWLMFYGSPRTVTLTACITFLFSHTETLVLLLRDCTPWPTEEVSQKYVRRADPNVTNQRQIPITTRVKLKQPNSELFGCFLLSTSKWADTNPACFYIHQQSLKKLQRAHPDHWHRSLIQVYDS